MATAARVAQKERLYSLLVVKKAYEKAGLPILPELKQAISHTAVIMRQEDIAHIEKQVEEN